MIIKSDYKFATEIRPKVFRNYKSSIKGHTNLPYLKHAAKNRCSLHDYKLNMKDISRRDIPWLAYTPLNMLLSSKYHMLGWGRDTLSEYSNMCEDASGVEYIILNRKDAGTTVWIKY